MRPERANANPLMDLVRHSLAGALLFNAMSKPKSWDSLTPEAQEAWKQKERARLRKYRAENPEKTRELLLKYWAKNTEKINDRKRKYYAKNTEKINENMREWRAKNPKKTKEYGRKHHAKNLEEIREKQRKQKRKYRNQKAADQFFILAGAAESLTNLITQNKKTE